MPLRAKRPRRVRPLRGLKSRSQVRAASFSKKKQPPYRVTVLFGGRYKTRTCDLPHVKRMRYQLRQSSVSLDRIHPFCGFVKPFSAGIVKNVFRAGRIHSAQNGQTGRGKPLPCGVDGVLRARPGRRGAHGRASAAKPELCVGVRPILESPARRRPVFLRVHRRQAAVPAGDLIRHPPCGRRRMPPSPRAGKAFSLLSVLPFIRLALIRSRFFSSRCGPCRGWRRTAPAPRGPRESR